MRLRSMLNGKIHRAVVTDSDLNYEGSITVDGALLDAAGILESEEVQIVNINNGNRFKTYTIRAEENSGIVCLNGAAARLAHRGDFIIILSYLLTDEKDAKSWDANVVIVDESNKIKKVGE